MRPPPRRPRWTLVLPLVACTPRPTQPPDPAPAAQNEGRDDDAPPVSLEAALSKLRTGDAAAAVPMLRTLSEQDPQDGSIWIARGVAERMAGDLPASIDSFEHASALDDVHAQALYELAVSHALAEQTDLAFAQLTQAAATREVDITGFAATPGLAGLGQDPRFLALLPDAAELDDPFVEDVRVLRQWRGEAPGDQFGWIARNIGDVDGDGLADVVTSAPTNGEGGTGAGKVYVYSSANGRLRWSRTGKAGSGLGMVVEAAGDVDGDGTPDVVAGAPAGGHALVLSGRDGSTVLELSGTAEDQFGGAVGDVGDVDGDGRADLLVGVPGHDGSRGMAILVAGRDGRHLATLPGERPGERFGSTVAGDVDPSGTTRIVVGAPDAGPAMRGTVRMYESDRTQSTTLRPTHTLTPQDTGSEFGGMFLSFVGEIDADGTPDVFVTDWSDAARGPSTGRAYVFSGASGARLQVFTGEAPGDCLGIGVGDAGDLDGDGRTELVFGAWRHGSAAPVAGRVYLHRADGRLWQTYTAKVMGETFGFDATGIGDLDGDGVGDLLLTSAWAPVGGARTGRVFVLAGPRRPSSG